MHSRLPTGIEVVNEAEEVVCHVAWREGIEQVTCVHLVHDVVRCPREVSRAERLLMSPKTGKPSLAYTARTSGSEWLSSKRRVLSRVLTEVVRLVLPRGIIQKEPARTMEAPIALHRSDALVLRCERVHTSGVEGRSSRRVRRIQPKECVHVREGRPREPFLRHVACEFVIGPRGGRDQD